MLDGLELCLKVWAVRRHVAVDQVDGLVPAPHCQQLHVVPLGGFGLLVAEPDRPDRQLDGRAVLHQTHVQHHVLRRHKIRD